MDAVREWLNEAKKVNPTDGQAVFRLLHDRPKKVWKRYERAVEKWYQRLGGMALFHVELERMRYAKKKAINEPFMAHSA